MARSKNPTQAAVIYHSSVRTQPANASQYRPVGLEPMSLLRQQAPYISPAIQRSQIPGATKQGLLNMHNWSNPPLLCYGLRRQTLDSVELNQLVHIHIRRRLFCKCWRVWMHRQV